ncbi:MAG: hypothetical protein Hyperionvirus4_132 [Hyperionvirus sp.]|uniref:Uncharacterized protein n=1 Tax=Hyperionvirus sp. TaxID=2487770 RepID=A0A3G5A7E8_9VIRU|nr:MAG: hypothetical protein Hyperionvirus4_132 [Hyperionvirus sp.]
MCGEAAPLAPTTHKIISDLANVSISICPVLGTLIERTMNSDRDYILYISYVTKAAELNLLLSQPLTFILSPSQKIEILSI